MLEREREREGGGGEREREREREIHTINNFAICSMQMSSSASRLLLLVKDQLGKLHLFKTFSHSQRLKKQTLFVCH